MGPREEPELERWKEVERLYGMAVALPAGERDAFLDRECGAVGDLRREVESLLLADARAGDFLDRSQLEAHLSALGGGGDAPALAGRTLAHYQDLHPIGSGAMGEVFAARDPRLRRQVALKVLHADRTDPSFIARFVREAQAASALNHPNIITVYEVGEADGIHFMATELIEGVSLRARLADGPLPPVDALEIAVQCASALETAHRAGILHRDIKPENIMIRPDGLAKVVDFGLARLTEPYDVPAAGTLTGVIMGTPRYMSPEQARGQDLDARTDVFSLGTVLYEMVVGQPRFGGETPADVFASLLGTDARPVETVFRDVPDLLRPVARRALEKDREHRYPTMEAFARDLRELRSTVMSAGDRIARPRLRRPGARVRGAAAVLAVVALATAGWFALRPSPAPMAPLVPIPFTVDPGWEVDPRLSPDGSRVAYTRSGADEAPEIVVQPIGAPGSAARVIVRHAFSPAWSPQGDALAVLRSQSPNTVRRDVLLVPVSGGRPRKLTEVSTPGAIQDWLPGAYLDFSPDGRYLVSSDGWGTDSQSNLSLISTESGAKVALTDPGAGATGDFAPRFSPNGRRIVFSRLLPGSAADLYVLDLTADMRPAGLENAVASEDIWNASPAWTPDGRRLLFVGGLVRQGRLKVVRLGSNQPPALLPLVASGITELDLRPSGQPGAGRIVFTRFVRDNDVVRIGINGQEHEASGRPVRLIDSSSMDEWPQYSPDGSVIAFISNRTGWPQVWLVAADGTDPRQITRFEPGEANLLGLVWAPDGRSVALRVIRRGVATIDEVAIPSGRIRRLVEGEVEHSTYSPDGQWLYFRSTEQRTPKIWRVATAGGPPELMPDFPGGVLQFTPDGRALVYAHGLRVFMRPLEGGAPTLLFAKIYAQESFVAGRSGVYALARMENDERWGLFAWRYADGRITPVDTVARPLTGSLSISPDERFALLTEREHQVLDLMLIDDVPLDRLP